jgi:surfeit locus 1 family protein
MFGRQWWWSTLLAIAAVAVMVRLGIWQLDRLAQRRAFNARVNAQQARPALDLAGPALGADLAAMEYRAVRVVGRYDPSQEVALRNQARDDRLGVHLLTPLVIEGGDVAVLVDRGWVPAEQGAPEQRGQFAEPGLVEVRGIIRASQARPDFGGVPDPPTAPGERLLTWNMVNVERIAQQASRPLLPIYIQQAPDPAWSGLPARALPELDLSEGPHMGYAVQWFVFAAVLALGYPRFVWHQSGAPAARQARDGVRNETIDTIAP